MSTSANARLSSDSVVNAAITLLDRDGGRPVTLAELASFVSVKPPSLYTHVASLEDLTERVRTRGRSLLVEALREASVGRSGKEALRSVAHAYRSFGRQHPGVYPVLFRGEAAAGEAVRQVLLKAISPDRVDEDHQLAATIILSGLHGFVSLEIAGQLGPKSDPDRKFDQLLRVLWKAVP